MNNDIVTFQQKVNDFVNVVDNSTETYVVSYISKIEFIEAANRWQILLEEIYL